MTAKIRSSCKILYINTFFKVLFFSGGIHRNVKYQKYGTWYSWWYTFYTFFILLGNCVGISNRRGSTEKLEILIQISHMVLFLAQHWGIKNHGNTLMNFASEIEQSSLRYTDNTAILQTELLFSTTLKTLGPIFYAMFGGVLLFSVLESLFIEVNFNDSKMYVMPFLYECSESGKNNFPIKFLCWKIDSYWKYVSVNSIAIFSLFIQHFSYVSTVCFHIIVQKYLVAHFNDIKQKILVLSIKMEAKSTRKFCILNSDQENYEKILLTDLIYIMKYYQHTRGYVHTLYF